MCVWLTLDNNCVLNVVETNINKNNFNYHLITYVIDKTIKESYQNIGNIYVNFMVRLDKITAKCFRPIHLL